MRTRALALFGAVAAAAALGTANAAPAIPARAAPAAADIVQVAGCGWGFHWYHGHCVRNHRYYRPYAYYHPYYYPYYGPYPYYGGGYEPWNRPSPSDHVANQLNAQELHQGYWWGY